ncbi:uncharacterized protein LOC131952573 isoform X2 [Physella acuta]|uniref:uncharacterized protein LOC131952573 isoform X2 n=1 Tax=Physella acuta TaxID=109671 RepID=UPI0027DD7E58|nr:uncharacterized protein LOC131952573 isoform X2 [Physella acuta]
MENPEAILDILSLRSFNKRYHEASDIGITDTPIGIQSLTKSEDLETFARDLTIDNSISACFEDSSLSSSDIGVNCRQPTQMSNKNVKISTSIKESDMLVLLEKEQDNFNTIFEVTMDSPTKKQLVSEEYELEKPISKNNAVLPSKISDISLQNFHKLRDEVQIKQQYKDCNKIMSAKDTHQSEKISQKTKQIGLELATVNGKKNCLSEKKSHQKYTNENNVSIGLHCVHAQGETQTKQIEPASHDKIIIINNCHNSNEAIQKLKAFAKLPGNLQLPEKGKSIKKKKLDICDDFDFDDLSLNPHQYQDKSPAQLKSKSLESNQSISNSMKDQLKIVEVVSFQKNSTTLDTVDIYGPISKLNDEQKFVNSEIHMCCAEESNAHGSNNAVGSYAKQPCKPDHKISQFESEHYKLHSCQINKKLFTKGAGPRKPLRQIEDYSLKASDENTMKNQPVSCSEKIKLKTECDNPSDSISPFVETFMLEMINRELIHQVFGKQFLIERCNSMLSEVITNLSMSQILDSLNAACEHIKLLENDKTQTPLRDATEILKNLQRSTLNLTEFKFSIQVIQDKMALELMETCFDDSIEILTLSRALFHEALSIAKVHPQDLNKKIKDLVVNNLKRTLAEVSCFSSPAINYVTKKRECMEVPSHTSLIQEVKQIINSANSDNSSNFQSNGQGLKTLYTTEDTPSLELPLLSHTDRDHLNILNPDEKYPQEKKGNIFKKKSTKNTLLPNEMPGLDKKIKDFENELENFENNPSQRQVQIKQNIQHHNGSNTSLNQCNYINNNDHDNLLLTSQARNYESCRESNSQRNVCDKNRFSSNCKSEKKRQKYFESCRRGRRKHRKFWNESWYKRQKHNYTSKLSSTFSSTQSTALSEKPNFYLQKISYKSKNASFSNSLSKKQKKFYCDNYESDDEDECFVGVRVNVENEDLTDEGLRIHRLQRHLQSVQKLRQNNEEIIETIITGTGEKLVPHDQCTESKDCLFISDPCRTSRSTNALAEIVFGSEGHCSQKPLSRSEVQQRRKKTRHFLNTAICEVTPKVKCNVFNMKLNEQAGFGIPWDQLNFTESDETDVSEKI